MHMITNIQMCSVFALGSILVMSLVQLSCQLEQIPKGVSQNLCLKKKSLDTTV